MNRMHTNEEDDNAVFICVFRLPAMQPGSSIMPGKANRERCLAYV